VTRLELLLPVLLCALDLLQLIVDPGSVSLELMRLLLHFQQVVIELTIYEVTLLPDLAHLSIEVAKVVLHLGQVTVTRWHRIFALLV